MGQKVHPYGFRLGYNKDWHSHWFAKKEFSEFLAEDLDLKRELKKKFAGGGVSHIDIERAATRLKIIIYTSRPGIIIGRKGAEIEKLREDLPTLARGRRGGAIERVRERHARLDLSCDHVVGDVQVAVQHPVPHRAVIVRHQGKPISGPSEKPCRDASCCNARLPAGEGPHPALRSNPLSAAAYLNLCREGRNPVDDGEPHCV